MSRGQTIFWENKAWRGVVSWFSVFSSRKVFGFWTKTKLQYRLFVSRYFYRGCQIILPPVVWPQTKHFPKADEWVKKPPRKHGVRRSKLTSTVKFISQKMKVFIFEKFSLQGSLLFQKLIARNYFQKKLLADMKTSIIIHCFFC